MSLSNGLFQKTTLLCRTLLRSARRLDPGSRARLNVLGMRDSIKKRLIYGENSRQKFVLSLSKEKLPGQCSEVDVAIVLETQPRNLERPLSKPHSAKRSGPPGSRVKFHWWWFA